MLKMKGYKRNILRNTRKGKGQKKLKAKWHRMKIREKGKEKIIRKDESLMEKRRDYNPKKTI